MHYILGTTVRVSSSRVQTSGPRSITGQQVKRTNNTPFDATKVYTLYNIQKCDEGVKYTFTDNTGEELNLTFDQPSDADRCIAIALGEQLPDHENFWARNTA